MTPDSYEHNVKEPDAGEAATPPVSTPQNGDSPSITAKAAGQFTSSPQ